MQQITKSFKAYELKGQWILYFEDTELDYPFECLSTARQAVSDWQEGEYKFYDLDGEELKQ